MNVEELRDGNQQEWADFYNAQKSRVRSIAYTQGTPYADLDDVMQESMITIWLRRDHLDPAKNTDNYVHSVAISRSVDHYRHEQHRPHLNQADDIDPEHAAYLDVPSPIDTEQQALAGVQLEDVLHTIYELPQPEQTLLLARAEGFTQSEISKATGIPLGTVKTHTREALTAL